MKEQFHDLSFEVMEDGTIRLEQHDYCGESVIVEAHPQQIHHIARSLQSNVSKPVPQVEQDSPAIQIMAELCETYRKA